MISRAPRDDVPLSKALRLLVSGVGTGASNNLIRSLRAGNLKSSIVGYHHDRFVLMKSSADVNYFVPAGDDRSLANDLSRIIAAEDIDLIIPNSDDDVRRVSKIRGELSGRCFLPEDNVIALCQDKHALSHYVRARGIPAPLTLAIGTLDAIDDCFRDLPPAEKYWCRMRVGNGSMGALPVTTAAQARSWIAYWQDMRGVPTGSFTLSEYLPGRDFAAQGVWKDGVPVILKICERLSYFGGKNQPSGTSSTPALGRLVADQRVSDICERVIHALDANASGVFSIDFKEAASGMPCVTEVNAGRFCMITNIFDLTGKNNMALIYLRLALNQPVELQHEAAADDDYYLVRDLDTLPTIFRAEAMFEHVREVGE